MIAELIERGDYYIYSNCRMRQHALNECCEWCDASFSNYQDILFKIFKLKEKTDEV